MPPESGLPRMSSSSLRSSGRDTRRQCTRSREWWICTPGYHSNVDVAMKKSSPTRTMDGSGLNPGRIGLRILRDIGARLRPYLLGLRVRRRRYRARGMRGADPIRHEFLPAAAQLVELQADDDEECTDDRA